MVDYGFPYGSGGFPSGSPLDQILGGARAGICELYRNHPDFLTGGDPGDSALRSGILASFCSPYPGGLPPPPMPPYAGGQCRVLYEITVRWMRNPPFDQAPVESSTIAFGEIRGLRFNSERAAIQVSAYRNQDSTEPEWIDVATGENMGVNDLEFARLERSDNLPDDCGNPPPVFPPSEPPTEDETNIDIDVEFAPGFNFTFEFPIELNWNENNIGFQVEVNPDFNLNVDVGGISFTTGGGGLVDNDSNVINNINNTVNNVNNNVNNVVNNVNNIQDDIDDIKDTLDDIGECDLSPVLSAIASFREYATTQFDTLNDSLEYQLEILKLLIPKDCELVDQPSTIVTEQNTSAGHIVFVTIPANAILVYIDITSYDPKFVRAYKLNDSSEHSEFGFGNWSLSRGGQAGARGSSGERHDLWTRRTAIVIEESCPRPSFIRISMKRGISYRVQDSGYRKIDAELPPR